MLLTALALPGAASGGVLDAYERRVTASDAATGTYFGSTVAMGGQVALVTGGGAVYVLGRDVGGSDNWGEVKKLGLPTFWSLGWSAAISGDTAIVGARYESPGGVVEEAAYVFQRHLGGPDNWGEAAKLSAPDTTDPIFFGRAVAVGGDTVVVGASREDSAGEAAGAAYVFQRDAGGSDNWGDVAKLTAPDAEDFGWFGQAVALSGDTIVVGAVQQPGDLHDSGAAYVFERDEGGVDNWGVTAKLGPSDEASRARFGHAVAISGDTAIVGAFAALGAEERSGAAYVFERDLGGPGMWAEAVKLTAFDTAVLDQFGAAVGISGDRAVVGAELDRERAILAGAVYVYERDAGGPARWGQVKKLTASDAAERDSFGAAVDIDGDTVISGAHGKDGGFENSGAVYLHADGYRCEAGPVPCTAWGSGSISINEISPGDGKLKIVLGKGPPLTQMDWGTPGEVGGTQYRICLYDDSSQLVARLGVSRAAGACNGKDCWKPTGGDAPSGKGYRYKDPNRSSDGVKTVVFKGGVVQSKLILSGGNKTRKGQTYLPTGLTTALSGSMSATVQVHGDDLAQCHAVTYDNVKVAVPGLFKAKR